MRRAGLGQNDKVRRLAALLPVLALLAAASNYWPTVHRSLPASFGQEFDAIVPAASILGGTLIHGLFMTGFVVAVASFVAAHVRQPLLRISLLVAGALAVTGRLVRDGLGCTPPVGK